MFFQLIFASFLFHFGTALFVPIGPHGNAGLPESKRNSPRFALPILPGLDVDPLTLKDIVDFVPGWGVFNLGTDAYKIHFEFQNQKGNYVEQILKPEDLRTFQQSSWDNTQKTIIVIHGYTEDGNDSPLSATKKIISAYVQAKRPENLVFVDWHRLSRQVNYFNSANNTEKVGLRVAELLIFLRNSDYIQTLDDVHIVGFSLGAHCAGIAAYNAGNFLKEPVGRVTGLDPAGPGFRDADLPNRLDKDDATFVDVIHTDMGVLLTTFGTPRISGDIDFFPNGGEHQPGCSLAVLGELVGVCSHLKAPEYFINSITGTDYRACPCQSYEIYTRGICACSDEDAAHMGEFVDSSKRGLYYLTIALGQAK